MKMKAVTVDLTPKEIDMLTTLVDAEIEAIEGDFIERDERGADLTKLYVLNSKLNPKHYL